MSIFGRNSLIGLVAVAAMLAALLLALTPARQAHSQANCTPSRSSSVAVNTLEFVDNPSGVYCFNITVPKLTTKVEISLKTGGPTSYDLHWKNGSTSLLLAADLETSDVPYVIGVDEYRLSSQDRTYTVVLVANASTTPSRAWIGLYAKDAQGAIMQPAGAGSGTSDDIFNPIGAKYIAVGARSSYALRFTAACGHIAILATWRDFRDADLQDLKLELLDPKRRIVFKVPNGRSEGGAHRIFYPISADQVVSDTTWTLRLINQSGREVEVFPSIVAVEDNCPQAPQISTPTATPQPEQEAVRSGVIRAGSYANTRSGPGTQYSVVRQVQNGEVVEIYEERTTSSTQYRIWYRIDSPTGPWIWSNLVRLTATGAVQTATATPATATPAAATSIRFQKGRFPTTSYTGAAEAVLSQEKPNTQDKSAGCLVDGDDPSESGLDKTTLLYWDVGAIKPGVKVTSATITLEVFNETADTYHLYAMLRPWSSTQATWLRATGSRTWQKPGATGAQDRGSIRVGEMRAAAVGPVVITLNSSGRQLVEDWINGEQANNGLAFTRFNADDGLDFYCSTASPSRRRPLLTVVYE